MKIYLASDHAGFELKEKIKKFLLESNYEVQDFGALIYDAKDDYPDFMHLAAKALSEDGEDSRAIIFGGGGQGEAMVANRYKGVRAAVFYGIRLPISATDIVGRVSVDQFEQVRLCREHNNANALALAARFLSEGEALTAVNFFLAAPFSGDERHVRRLAKF